MVTLLANLTSAQTAQHALGLRFGTGDGFGTEISYQHGLTSGNRLELDMGFNSNHEYYLSNRYNYNSWGLTGLYHWVSKLEYKYELVHWTRRQIKCSWELRYQL